MEQKDKNEFAEIINDLCELFGKKPSKGMYRLYYHSMVDFRLDEIEKAISLHLTDTDSGKFFPKPADLIKHLSKGNSTREIKNEQARKKWLEKKANEIKTGNPAFSKEEVTRIEMGL